MKKILAGAAVVATVGLGSLGLAGSAQAVVQPSPETGTDTVYPPVVSPPKSTTVDSNDVTSNDVESEDVAAALPNTGGPDGLLLGGAAALLLAGGTAVVVARRRQTD